MDDRNSQTGDGTLCPVLVVPDPALALDQLADVIGLDCDRPAMTARSGDLTIVVAAEAPSGLVAGPFDHLALRVADVDRALDAVLRRGGRLHAGFTPDGPKDIAAFWDAGVRYAFVEGPDGVPLELIAPIGGPARDGGLDHLGLRTADVAGAAGAILSRGGRAVASHLLGPPGAPVHVEFLREGGLMWELFDEPPLAAPDAALWAGVIARR